MIVLYHHIAPQNKIAAIQKLNEGWEFTISSESFERHLLELRRWRYEFISLSELVYSIKKLGREPRKVAVITFDDGWRDNYEFALPILRDLNIPACFFITTDILHSNFKENRKMSVDNLRELLHEGMEIGSHTRRHPDLTKVSEGEATIEISNSKTDLEKALGCPVNFFAYPGGAFNRKIVTLVKEAGYSAACSVLSPRSNNKDSLYWLYRNTLTGDLNALGDLYRLSPMFTKLLEFRVKRRLVRMLDR
jgi:peptidoglycan/xylan/chitin deacetylase (PgdA/CDA1 family)